MARMVNCAKLGRELPGLNRPPFGGELGKRIFENISQDAWALWQDQSTLLINHYGLNVREPKSKEFLFSNMEKFLFGEQDAKTEKAPTSSSPPA